MDQQDRLHVARILARAMSASQGLFAEGRFVITNDALVALMDGFGRRLVSAFEQGDETELVERWRRQVSAFGENLLKANRIRSERAGTGGGPAIISVQDVRVAEQMCFPRPPDF